MNQIPMRTTTLSRSAPWDSIPIPTADFNVIRVGGSSGVPIFWGRDTAAQCLLIVELVGDFTLQFRRDMVSLRGIGIDLRNSDAAGRQRLILTVTRLIDNDLFLGLSTMLISSEI